MSNHRSRPWVVVGLVVSPLGALAVLCWGLLLMIQNPPTPFGPPVGAGSGRTGGANAIGELLAGNRADHSAASAAGLIGENPSDSPAGSQPAPAAEAKMVDPESLPQGFILVVEDKAKLATQTSPIYMASNLFTNWSPGDKKFQLTAQSDMRWRIEVPQPPSWEGGRVGTKLAFKFTRGSWELEELMDDMSAPANRTLAKIDASKLAPGEKPIIELSVSKWGDQRPEFKARRMANPYAPIDAEGTVRRLQVVGGSGGAEGLTREVLVWLPPGYDAPENAVRRYPVLYLMDGQNVFSKPENVPGEWRADETATQLIESGRTDPFIIVAVPNSGAGRMREYLPVDALDGVRPAGREFVAWLTDQVMPRVERAFRVETDPSKVAIGGSSLGAVISLYAAVERPDRFGLLLAESLPLRTGRAEAWESYLASVKAWPKKTYLGMGGAETGRDPARAERNKGYVDAVRGLYGRMEKAGVTIERRMLKIAPDAEHTESAWAERLPTALVFLFGRDDAGATGK